MHPSLDTFVFWQVNYVYIPGKEAVTLNIPHALWSIGREEMRCAPSSGTAIGNDTFFDQSKPALLTKYQEVYRARSLDLWKKEKYYDKYVELDCLGILLRRQFDACVCRADAEKERLKINSWFSLPHEKEMGGENGARFVLFFCLGCSYSYRNRFSQAEKKKNLLEAKREEHS